ncbi:hypothetical protein E1B28_009275 [Marasmius oreades]|uniref:Plasma-membrane choline transporter-domain-containing protein n=1 Tax=Marasmius oreades TaxID=181124 RepID=A0A9P7UV52_9AGAR|nr:uncharacterized protein E1B28_009275 [Marasmius oreades]KAG7092974.1 hypothetical protein E1B28_009275 [Marasmius oreades]
MSFAVYASQFINRQNGTSNAGETNMSSSQPMFFSFTTDNSGSDGEGSRADRGRRGAQDAGPGGSVFGSGWWGNKGGIHDGRGRARGRTAPDFNELDENDPHLIQDGEEDVGNFPRDVTRNVNHGDEDPYLRLDEEEPHVRRTLSQSRSPSPQGGWLAHHGRLSSSSSSGSSSDDEEPPLDILVQQRPQVQAPPPRTNRDPVSLSLTESLLPRDGVTRPIDVFSLPDPRFTPRNRRKFQDSSWTALWLTGISVCLISSIVLLFVTSTSKASHNDRKQKKLLPYTTLLHTIPLLTILTFAAAVVSYLHVLLLRVFMQPVMIVTSVFVPATLFISFIWAFVGSFMWDEGQEVTWGETVGLRIFSVIPLLLSLYTARRLLHLPKQLHTSSATLSLVTRILMGNPFLLALSPVILLAMLLISIPFLTLIFRLLLIGYSTGTDSPNLSKYEWHIKPWANWCLVGAVAIWLWTWGVARGVLKMTCAGVVGAWYFADPPTSLPPLSYFGLVPAFSPTAFSTNAAETHNIHAALTRSTGSSLGTVVLSALILTAIRLIGLLTIFLDRLPEWIDALGGWVARVARGGISSIFTGGIGGVARTTFARGTFMGVLVSITRAAVGYLEGVTLNLSKYAVIYAGLTGEEFWVSARRGSALTAMVASKSGGVGRVKEPPLALLTLGAPLTLTFPFALAAYLFVAHTLNAPHEALGTAVLAGGVTALVGTFCVGLVGDGVDTLWMCYCIDRDSGIILNGKAREGREEVVDAFEYNSRAKTLARHQAKHPQHPQRQPPRPGPSSRPHQPIRSQPLRYDTSRAPEETPQVLFDVVGDVEAQTPRTSQPLAPRSPSPSPSSSSSHTRSSLVPPESLTLMAHHAEEDDMDPFVGEHEPEPELELEREMGGSQGKGDEGPSHSQSQSQSQLFPGSDLF